MQLPERFTECMELALKYGLQPKKLQWVHAFADKPAWIFLMEMVKGGSYGLEVLPPLIMYNEDGSLENLRLSFTGSDGIERDEYGNEIDSVQPTADTILKLMDGPELMHKGEWLMWFGAVCVCILNGLSILFADELFRWNLSFQIRNAEHAEPSEMQIAGRYTSWTILTIMALVLFIMGLR